MRRKRIWMRTVQNSGVLVSPLDRATCMKMNALAETIAAYSLYKLK